MAKTALKFTLMAACGALLSLFAAGGCTYDYLEDETNFLLHVPQIESGEIQDFYVSFHKIDLDGGRHILTRRVSAPFSGIEGGVLRFKLLPGKYDISTFADVGPGSLTEGQHLGASFKSERPMEGRNGFYAAESLEPRARFLRGTEIYYLGSPECEVPVEDDIDEECKLKGEVVCRFRDFPSTALTHIVTTYKGLSTRYDFDGVFNRFSGDDSYLHDHVSLSRTGGDIEISNMLFPSSGMDHQPRDPLHGSTVADLDMTVQFWTATGMMGEATLNKAEFDKLLPAQKPVDKNGNPLAKLVLAPRNKIMVTFKDFTIVGIGLNEWNDPTQGDVTIH